MEILVTCKCCIKPLITNNLPKIYERFFFLKIANPFSSNVSFPGSIEVEHWLKIVNGKKLKKNLTIFEKCSITSFQNQILKFAPLCRLTSDVRFLVLFYY